MDHSGKKTNRREFINKCYRYSVAVGVTGLVGGLTNKIVAKDTVWQLDPTKCTQCGKCATNCVMTPSAIKCIHVYDMCGYCDLCGGYFRPNSKELTTGAENQLCPTGAIKRKYVEDPFFQYEIDEELCIGCGICVKGCGAFGNGSLQLQVNHDLCKNCNQCTVATACPSNAFTRVPADEPYLFTGYKKQ
ncbi:ferredoxin [Marinilabiliaceae bacterium JC017]|nr:ferredoxin [Marinilabiliaceae bacterium JC017]